MSTATVNGQSEQVGHDSFTVKRINDFFNSSKTRHQGWKLLTSFLPQCPDEYLLQFCVSWMQNCCKIDGSAKNKEDAVNLLSELFKSSKKYPELRKSVSFFITSQYFDFFFKYFINTQAGWHCTKNCLLFYNGPCGSYQDDLQKHLTEEINKNSRIPLHIAECFAIFPSIGGGGIENATYKRNWRTQFLKLLSICHSILNDLYGDAEELKLQEFETPEHSYNKSEKHRGSEYLVNQLHNYVTVLNCMLLNQYPAPKSIPPDLIFQLICRGLALNPKSLVGRRTTQLIALQKVLSRVHAIFLSLLKAVVVACKNLLFPYAHLICKLIKQILEWTDADSAYGGDKSVGKLKISAYEALCNWFAAARNGSRVTLVSSAVLASAVGDIVSKKAVVFLKAKRQSKGKEPTSRRINAPPDNKLCYSALKCLQFFLKFAGVSLKPEEHKFLQEVVVELLLEIQRTATVDIAAPFNVTDCRKELYSLLLELVRQPCTKWPPPTHFALELFSKGVNDASPEVSSFCSSALNFTTIIIHPQYDNGGFSPRETTERRNFAEAEIMWTEQHAAEKESFEEIVKNDEDSSIVSDPAEKLSDQNEDVITSSDEDSATTVVFPPESEPQTGRAERVEEAEVKVQIEEENSQDDEEPSPKKRKISEEPAEEETLTRAQVELLDATPRTKEVTSGKNYAERSEDLLTPQGPTFEETHPKKRYFLRSKTKGSSDELEDAVKSGSSPESGKSTPSKPLPKNTPSRPNTRALSRRRTFTESEAKAAEKDGQDNDDVDEENLKAAFDDCLVD